MKAPAGTAGTTDKGSSKDSIYYREDHLLLTEAPVRTASTTKKITYYLLLTEAPANPAYSTTEKSTYY